MKNIAIYTLCAVLFASCASSKFDITQSSPALLVTVVSNLTIPWQMEEGSDDDNDDNPLTTAFNSVFGANNPEVTSGDTRVEYCQDALRTLFEDNAGIEVVSSDVLHSSPSYDKTKSTLLGTWAGLNTPEGEKIISYSNSQLARQIMRECGAKSAIYANFKFEKYTAKGTKANGRVGVCVTMECVLLDSKGHIAKQSTIYVESSASTPCDMGKYNKDAIVDMVPDIVDAAINNFIFSL